MLVIRATFAALFGFCGAVAGAQQPAADDASNRILPFAAVAPISDEAQETRSAVHCDAERSLCLQAWRGDGTGWTLDMHDGLPTRPNAAVPRRIALPEGEDPDRETHAIWPHLVREASGALLIGIERHRTAGFSGGGAGATQTLLFRLASPGAEPVEVLNVQTSYGAMIRACFSEDEYRNRGVCHDEYEMTGTLALGARGRFRPAALQSSPLPRAAIRAARAPTRAKRAAIAAPIWSGRPTRPAATGASLPLMPRPAFMRRTRRCPNARSTPCPEAGSMDAFSYLSVLTSIILGLGIQQVLLGYRALILSRRRVKFYAPPLIWSVLLLFMVAQHWWASFGLADHQNWSFASFATVLVMTALDLHDGGDRPARYSGRSGDRPPGPLFPRGAGLFRARRRPSSAGACSANICSKGELPEPANLLFHAVFAAMALIAMLIRRPRVHEALAVLMSLLFATYIALLVRAAGRLGGLDADLVAAAILGFVEQGVGAAERVGTAGDAGREADLAQRRVGFAHLEMLGGEMAARASRKGAASAGASPSKITTNSSPPSRATIWPPQCASSRSATRRRTRSPTPWP